MLTEVHIFEAMLFPVVHVCMWELDHKEGSNTKELVLSNCGAGKRLLRVPWTARKSNQSILKEINPEYSLGLMLKLKLQYFGHLIWRADWLEDPDAGKDWRQKEKRATEDEMVGWHHWFNGYELGWTPGNGEGQGGLVCCHSRGRKESDVTEWLNNNNLVHSLGG